MLNCPNCGATLSPHQFRCEYCGTAVIDLGTFDLENPCYVRFKAHDPRGREFAMIALVETKNSYFEMYDDTVNVYNHRGCVVNKVRGNHTLDIHLDLNCLIATPERNELATIVYQ